MWKKNRDGTPRKRKFLVLVAAVLAVTTSLFLVPQVQGSEYKASAVWRDANVIYTENYVAKIIFTSNGTLKANNGVYILDPSGTVYYYKMSFKIQRDNAGTIETYFPLNTNDINYTNGTDFIRVVVKSTLALNTNDTITLGTLYWNLTFYTDHFDMFVNISTDATNKITLYAIYLYNYRTTTTAWYIPFKLKDTMYTDNQTFGRKIYGDRAYMFASDTQTGFSLFAETRDPLLRDVSHPSSGIWQLGYVGAYNTRSSTVTAFLYASRFAEPREYSFYIASGTYSDLLKKFKGYTLWAYPYGLEGVFTITWDDGIPDNTPQNDTAFAELATKYNFYYNRYIWIYFPNAATAGSYFKATPAWLDQNSTLLSEYQNLTKMGIYVDMHGPSRLNDTRSIFISAIDEMNKYFSNEWGVIYQPHSTNAENPNEQGANPANTTYFTYDLVVQNYHFLNDRYWGADPALSQTDRSLLDLFNSHSIIVYYSDYYSPNPDYKLIGLVTRNQYNNSEWHNISLADVIGKADIDYIVNNNAACVLYMHHPYSEDAVPRLEALFKYISEQPLWTPTAAQFYEYVYTLSRLNITISGNALTIQNPTDFAIDGLTIEPTSGLAVTDGDKVLPHSIHGYILPTIAAHSTVTFALQNVKSFEYYPTHIGATSVNIYKGTDGNIHAKVTGHGTVTVHIENIWNTTDVKVYDLTTGKEVKWREGSIIFNATAGHEYVIELPSGFASFISPLYNALGAFTMDYAIYIIIAVVVLAVIYIYRRR